MQNLCYKYNANVKNASAKNAEKRKKKKITQKQCIVITHYKCKLSLFGRDDTKQAISFIFIVVPQAEQIPKIQKKS